MPYNIRRPLSHDERKALAEHSDILAHLLFHRGLRTAEEAKSFIEPDYDSRTHDPFLLKDARKAAERIVRAIKNGERIAIYADYDADGIPGAALFHDFFRRINFSNFSIYIPHRHDEGFGVNAEAVRELAADGVKLVVTVDCGISDLEPIAEAVSRGMDVIVTDHHEPPAVLPPALAIIDHKQEDCAYPDKNLCGSGVAFKLIQGILKLDRLGLKDGLEKWLLDLVGIATLSDMVPLRGENRIFAKYGLSVLRKSPRLGLVRILRQLKIPQKHVNEDDIAFMITPRINAASRMGAPLDAFRMLAAASEEEARQSVEHLDRINNERKGVVASLIKEIKKKVHERHGSLMPRVIVLGNPAWRPSLLGLAANSCAEEFCRPVFLWGRDGGNVIKGSCRSEGVSNVVEIMRAVPAGILGQFGGHRHSGGFSVANDQIHFLEQRLNEASATLMTDAKEGQDRPREQFFIDMELRPDNINTSLWSDVEKLAPFGMDNPKPLFLFRRVCPAGLKLFGKNAEHVELAFKSSNGSRISAVKFFGAGNAWAKEVKVGSPMDLVASLEKSMYGGREQLRLRISEVFCKGN